jgi:hypothetical protein
MDDFNVTSLHESKNEWGARLLTILTPLIIEGFQSIYEESYSLCQSNNETEKHLMTFQNFISRIPKWNSNIVEEEQKRISDKSGCSYLEDLITCVHIIQLKLLTAVRVGSKQKKIDIKIPNINDFIHKVYINSARKIYKNVYLFERNVPPLQVQKHGRELEILIQESILNSVRESIPVDLLLRSYLDETTEEDVNVEIQEEEISVPSETPQTSPPTLSGGSPVKKSLTFSEQPSMSEPQPIKTLETISNNIQTEQLQLENEQNDSQSSEKLQISDLNGTLTHEDVHSLDPPSIEVIPDLMIDDIEFLP